MSTSLARIAANRLNAQASCGPVTPAGKAKASRNALKSGLFATLMVIPAAGETAEEFDRFRRRIVSDLAPSGILERELAVRIAGLLWRLRRVAAHEAAALAQKPVKLPPHPDEVDSNFCEPPRVLPPDAPTSVHLCAARLRIAVGTGRSAWCRRAAAAVRTLPRAGRTQDLLDVWGAVSNAVGTLLGWRAVDVGWESGLARMGGVPPDGPPERTAGVLRRALASAAKTAGRTVAEFRAMVAGRLDEEAARADEKCARELEREKQLAARLLEERQRAGAAAALADEAGLARVAKAEGHLSRELDRALAQLERLRSSRRSDASLLGVLARAAGPVGFVLPGAGSAPQPPANGTGQAALPAAG